MSFALRYVIRREEFLGTFQVDSPLAFLPSEGVDTPSQTWA